MTAHRELLHLQRDRIVRNIAAPGKHRESIGSFRKIFREGVGPDRKVNPLMSGGEHTMPWNEQDFIDIGTRVTQLERQRQEMLSGHRSVSEEINCFRVYFDSRCDEVRGQRDLLDRAVAAILQQEDRDVSITGHTDRHGNYHDNMALAAKRAIAVKHLLVIRGVPPGRIECVSAGFTNPRLSSDPSGDAADIMNRRVEISISARK